MANQTHDSTAKTQAPRPLQAQAKPHGQPLELESPGATAQRAQSALPEPLSPKDVLAMSREPVTVDGIARLVQRWHSTTPYEDRLAERTR